MRGFFAHLRDTVITEKQLFLYFPTILMIIMLVLGYLVSGIFAREFQWKADSILFSSLYGKNKAVSAKVKACFYIVTGIYWCTVLLYTGAVLLYLGADGAFCPVQANSSGQAFAACTGNGKLYFV